MQINNTLKKRAKLAFILYIICLFWIIILKCNLRQGVAESRYFMGDMTIAERIIFSLGHFAVTSPKEAILNVIIFIPVGVSTPFIVKKNPYMEGALLGTAISLIAEICQLLVAIGGFTYVDIINNSIGAFLGVTIHFCLIRCVKEKILARIIDFASAITAITIIYAAVNTINNIEIYILPAKELI